MKTHNFRCPTRIAMIPNRMGFKNSHMVIGQCDVWIPVIPSFDQVSWWICESTIFHIHIFFSPHRTPILFFSQQHSSSPHPLHPHLDQHRSIRTNLISISNSNSNNNNNNNHHHHHHHHPTPSNTINNHHNTPSIIGLLHRQPNHPNWWITQG